MRYIVFTVLCMTLVGCAGTKDLSPLGAPIESRVNTILVRAEKTSAKQKFKEVKQRLAERGFPIKHSDDDSFSVTTEFKNAATAGSDSATDVALFVTIVESNNGTTVVVRGKCRQGMKFHGTADLGEVDAEHSGMKGSVIRLGWDAMYGFAKSLKFDSMGFEKR